MGRYHQVYCSRGYDLGNEKQIIIEDSAFSKAESLAKKKGWKVLRDDLSKPKHTVYLVSSGNAYFFENEHRSIDLFHGSPKGLVTLAETLGLPAPKLKTLA